MNAFNDFRAITSASLHLRQGGTGSPVVLLHGLPDDSSSWQEVAPELAAQFEVWVPDLPGTGKSALPAGNTLSMEGMADSLREALIAQGLSTITLVGHSMGGYVALAFLEKYPQMLNGLALVHSTAAADSNEKKEQRQKTVSLLRGGKKTAYLKSMLEAFFAPSFTQAHPEIIAEKLAQAERLPAETLAQYNEAMVARPARSELLRDLKIPVQWVLGEQDSILPPDPVLALVALPSLSFLSVYKEVGHGSMIEAPKRLTADLLRFARLCAMH